MQENLCQNNSLLLAEQVKFWKNKRSQLLRTLIQKKISASIHLKTEVADVFITIQYFYTYYLSEVKITLFLLSNHQNFEYVTSQWTQPLLHVVNVHEKTQQAPFHSIGTHPKLSHCIPDQHCDSVGHDSGWKENCPSNRTRLSNLCSWIDNI